MEKVKLEIVGLSYSQTQSGAYALVLSEENGNRRLPIIIGGFEAQAIAIELEKMTPTRPLTHDLFKHFALAFEIKLVEILIYKLEEGIFYSKLICEKDGKTVDIDARTSDAIAVGVRFDCPVFTYEKILSSAGIKIDEKDLIESSQTEASKSGDAKEDKRPTPIKDMTIKELNLQLDKAIESEDYELASKLRDEINRRSS